ncbi:U32 family peptidase [Candidatus Woesearchaeota archaeon]|nr:U32 family peptidase [Candidatus Woesearchaeota archaeon]
MKSDNIELMAPAGSFESLISAIKAGADSVYFGVSNLNMRASGANNFTLNDIKKVVNICKKNNIKCYLTLNTIIYDNDFKLMKKICDSAKRTGVDAIIANDSSVLQYARSIGLNLHISTQANISNIEAVKFYSKYADVIVLARELTLDQIRKICFEIKNQKIKGPSGSIVKIEIFAHGALCVSIAGKCYMSLATFNASANRGVCVQNCRRAYRLIDDETGDELKVENKYIMSPKDLCTIRFLDKILNSGISVLKIEGRARKEDYVYTVVKVYREAIDSYFNNSYTLNRIKKWEQELSKVYNRGFWHGGYYLGKKLGEWAGSFGSQAVNERFFIGNVTNYFSKKKIGLFFITANFLKIGDKIQITGPTTGIVEAKVDNMFVNDKPATIANKGDMITIPIQEKIRKKDKLYLIRERVKSGPKGI